MEDRVEICLEQKASDLPPLGPKYGRAPVSWLGSTRVLLKSKACWVVVGSYGRVSGLDGHTHPKTGTSI